MKNFMCKIGFHKLYYVKRYRVTALLKCRKCNVEFTEGLMGELIRKP